MKAVVLTITSSEGDEEYTQTFTVTEDSPELIPREGMHITKIVLVDSFEAGPNGGVDEA